MNKISNLQSESQRVGKQYLFYWILEVWTDVSAAGEWAWEPQTEHPVIPVSVGFAAREALSEPRVSSNQNTAIISVPV